MTYADTATRRALIRGLRDLADYLESNPEVPAPRRTDIYTFPPSATCTEMRTEIDIIAAHLGNPACESASASQYIASRSFGPVEYQAVAICPHFRICTKE